MGTSMSASPATASDEAPAQCPVPTAIEIAKAIVRSAHPEDRYTIWERLGKGIDAARQEARESGNAMPWETPAEIGWISWSDFQDAVAAALTMVVEEVPERRRLVYVAKRAYDEITARGTRTTVGKPTKFGYRVCAREGCGVRFAAKSQRHIWHSATCRATAFNERKAMMEQAQTT